MISESVLVPACFCRMKKDKKCIKGVIQHERNHGNQAERYKDETGSSL